jgi:K+-transporting ATPase KdpF subunit
MRELAPTRHTPGTGSGIRFTARPHVSEGASTCSTSFWWAWGSSASGWHSPTPTPATGFEEDPMEFDLWLAGLVTAGLLVYLVYALLRPEQF